MDKAEISALSMLPSEYICKNSMGLNLRDVQSALFMLRLLVLDWRGLSVSEDLLLPLLSVCISVALSFHFEFSQGFQI